MSDDERAEYREERRQAAEALLDELLSEEGWQTWLMLRRSLYSYSWGNQVLIAVGAWRQARQAREGDPDAPATPCAERPTLVKSATRWRADGYHPAKGTRGLLIWAFRSRRRKDGSWSCCGARLTDETSCEKCGKTHGYFKVAAVFDASQVRSFETGEPPNISLPEGEPIEGDTPGALLLPVLAEWALAEGIADSVDLDCASAHGEYGSWHPVKRELRVCATVRGVVQSPNARLRVMAHELAHALGISSKNPDVELSYADAEVAVECVGYIVAGTAGLDTSGEAIPYMAGWGGEGARAKVRELAALIDATAKRIEAPILAALDAGVPA